MPSSKRSLPTPLLTQVYASNAVTWSYVYSSLHHMETFSAFLALGAGNSPVPVNSLHKGQWRRALIFSLIYARINDWVNDREAADLRRHCGHYDANVMEYRFYITTRKPRTIEATAYFQGYTTSPLLNNEMLSLSYSTHTMIPVLG